MKKLRLYYDEQGEIIYNIGLEGPGKYPRTVKKELDGLPPNTRVLELANQQQIEDFLKHEDNHIQGGLLILGKKAEEPSPSPAPRDYGAEIDALSDKIELLSKGG